MIDTPHITQTTAQLTASIHLTIPRSEIRLVMGPALSELMAAVKAQGVRPGGPWFSHHLKMDPEYFDFEVSVPVCAPVAAMGRVVGGEMPAVKVARVIYKGRELSASVRSRRTERWLISAVGRETSECPWRHCDRPWLDRWVWA